MYNLSCILGAEAVISLKELLSKRGQELYQKVLASSGAQSEERVLRFQSFPSGCSPLFKSTTFYCLLISQSQLSESPVVLSLDVIPRPVVIITLGDLGAKENSEKFLDL